MGDLRCSLTVRKNGLEQQMDQREKRERERERERKRERRLGLFSIEVKCIKSAWESGDLYLDCNVWNENQLPA